MKKADLAWCTIQAVGLAAGFAYGTWIVYWAVFAFVEVVGLATGWPFTSTVRGMLVQREGRKGFVRDVAVAVWSGVVVGTWFLYSPIWSPWRGLIGVSFAVWIIWHFFDRTEARHGLQEAAAD